MPLYEYRCKACGQEIEVMQKFSDPRLETCEACGGELKKLISNTSFILKGSGWYVTDYARKEQKSSKSNGGAGRAEAGSSDKDSGRSNGVGSSAKEGGGSSQATTSSGGESSSKVSDSASAASS